MSNRLVISSELLFLLKLKDERFVLPFNPLNGLPGFAGPRGPQPDPAPFRP